MTAPDQVANTRPAPPPLQPRYPDCSLCHEETRYEDDGYACERCDAWWPERVTGAEPGDWHDPDAPQCVETVKPYLDNTWIKDDDPRKEREFRCLLDAGHYEPGGDSMHANHEMTACARGWH